jgi:hypothetical protein
MSELSPVVEHLRKLAEGYHNTHMELQKQQREMTSPVVFLEQLRQREGTLVDRFRLVQQELIAALQGDQLEKMLDLSRIFDEIRVINQFANQTLTEMKNTDPAAREP